MLPNDVERQLALGFPDEGFNLAHEFGWPMNKNAWLAVAATTLRPTGTFEPTASLRELS